jgi:hypothetical protein
MAMEHRPLYACLKLLYTQAGLVPMRSALCRLIRQLYTHPRTLKQMCRVTIYNAVGRCSALSINKLPLPGPLKEYILNFDPWKSTSQRFPQKNTCVWNCKVYKAMADLLFMVLFCFVYSNKCCLAANTKLLVSSAYHMAYLCLTVFFACWAWLGEAVNTATSVIFAIIITWLHSSFEKKNKLLLDIYQASSFPLFCDFFPIIVIFCCVGSFC